MAEPCPTCGIDKSQILQLPDFVDGYLKCGCNVQCPLHSAASQLLEALERSGERLHSLTDEPICQRNLFAECPTHYCAEAWAAIKLAKKSGP